jgi:hypothetical protein
MYPRAGRADRITLEDRRTRVEREELIRMLTDTERRSHDPRALIERLARAVLDRGITAGQLVVTHPAELDDLSLTAGVAHVTDNMWGEVVDLILAVEEAERHV